MALARLSAIASNSDESTNVVAEAQFCFHEDCF